MIKFLVRLFALILILIVVLGIWLSRPGNLTATSEKIMNHFTDEYFAGSARLKSMKINPDLTFEMSGFEADFQAREGSVPIQIETARSIDPIYYFAQNKKVRFAYSGAKPKSSRDRGIAGQAILDLQDNGHFELDANIEDLGIEHMVWLNPDNLKGATGKMRGFARIETDASENLRFELEINLDQGGTIQAHFFDALTPYLPELKNQGEVRALIKAAGLVDYREAKFTMTLKDPTTMKMFLHILVPDYNLNLNLNIEVRLDEENAFLQVAELLGLIKIKVR